jgi:hypothetical protein
VPVPGRLARSLELYDALGSVDWDHHALFGETSFHAIVAGFGRLPRGYAPRAAFSEAAKVREIMATIRARHGELARTLPTHAEFIRALHA